MLRCRSGPVFSFKLRYILGFWLVEMVISTNQKPTIFRNLNENTGVNLSVRSGFHHWNYLFLVALNSIIIRV